MSTPTTAPSKTETTPESGSSFSLNEGRIPSRRRTPAIVYFAVLTALVLPIALVPYLVTRRHLIVLRRQLEEIKATTVTIRLETKSAWSETVKRNGEDGSEKALLHSINLKREVDGLRHCIAMEERHKTQMSHLQKLRNETLQPR